jgi:hypothetical protein
MALCGLLLSAQSDLPSILHLLPDGSRWPKYMGYVLALAAFSRTLGRRAGVDVDEPPESAVGGPIISG